MKRSQAFVFVLAFVFAACAAMQQQQAAPPRADQGGGRNLKVLPQNITHDELIATMRGFARSLGVKCDNCHVANPAGSKERLDFASDAKPEKSVARQMILMTRNINGTLKKITPDAETVGCWTCHRGKKEPEEMPPPPPEPGREVPQPQSHS
jgi:hypothetical protein